MAELEVLQDEEDKEQFDASVIIGKKPGRYYRWARNDDTNLIRRKLDGYDVCRDPDIKSVLNASTRMKKGQDVDDTIILGDMILVETTQENHDRLMERERKKIARRTKGVMEDFKRKIGMSPDGRPLAFEEHGKSSEAEGKGYGKGFTEKDLQQELETSPMNEGRSSWRRP